MKHQPFEFTDNCQNKRRFANEKDAQQAADDQMLMKMDLELSVYQCRLCGGWHLTRKPRLV
ncbi:MAG: hypothetical protein ABJA64_00820 [Candidatus Saccharibacteria bacterium]